MLRLATDSGKVCDSLDNIVLPSTISYALQPIVDAHSGAAYAYEALIRGTDGAGFDTIDGFFDTAFARGELLATENALHELAIATFRRLPHRADRKLFLNIDNRIFASEAFNPQLLAAKALKLGMPPASIAIELSEKHAAWSYGDAVTLVRNMRRAGVKIAIDDFGQGFSELKLLYEASPEYVKIDRFFVADIPNSARKRLFMSTVVNLAHVLGARVIAEGVETEQEFLTCREIGCDLIQGWYIARASRDLASLPNIYLLPLADTEGPADQSYVFASDDFEHVSSVRVDMEITGLLQAFRTNPDCSVLPVVDANNEPVGVVRERDFRSYVYSLYGAELLSNPAYPRHPADFVIKVPVVEIGSSIEAALNSLTAVNAVEGVIVTENLKYLGFVSPHTLLARLNERRLLAARDQNPLSHMPGNASINRQILQLGKQTDIDRVFCYFDFNHFKPFNDTYGFRLGDRAIMLFADILNQQMLPLCGFLGHIGGDDFFATFTGLPLSHVESMVDEALRRFREEIIAFYAPADRDRGFIEAEDREGRSQIYPFMTCSAAIMVLPHGTAIRTLDEFSRATAAAKRAAKLSPVNRITRVIGAPAS